ncbi:MAG: tyrosine--tRNA ligase [Gemmataceae bacterium]
MKSATEQLALIRRGVDQITPLDEFVKKLERSVATGKPLRVKYGIDPTGTDVHLGHTVPLRKLRLFQELGHKAVLIIGEATAMVGDPSGRDKSRTGLSREQIAANAKDYLAQIGRVIDLGAAEVCSNGDWFLRYGLTEVIRLTQAYSVQQMMEREDFTKRRNAGEPVYLSECLYPLMQGQDSVEIRADVELGGSEQLFNLMVGRYLQTRDGQEPQVCLTLPILRGLDGERRMGKSIGNYVGVGMAAQEQFDRTMSIPDTLLREWFDLLTDRDPAEVEQLSAGNPFEAKKQLAADIVRFYHGADAAKAARAEWERTKSQKQDPTEIPEVDLPSSALDGGKLAAFKLLVALGMAPSNNEARRLVQGGSMTVGPDRAKVADPNGPIEVTAGLIVRVGNRRIARVRLV